MIVAEADGLQDAYWLKANCAEGHKTTLRAPLPAFDIFDPLVFVARDDLLRQIFAGNGHLSVDELTGLSARYSTLDAQKAQSATCVIDAGGRRGALHSAWAVCWGQHKVGLATRDGAPLHSDGFVALVVADFRYVIRVANINAQRYPDIVPLMSRALLLLPTASGAMLYVDERLSGPLGDSLRGVPVCTLPYHEDELVA